MQSLGCFGSSLAHAPKSGVCKGCPENAACAAVVIARKPAMLKLLSKYADPAGRSMAYYWLTPAEKRRAKKFAAERESEAAMGDALVATNLMASVGRNARSALGEIFRRHLDPRFSPLDAIAACNPKIAAVIAALRVERQTVRDLTAALVTHCQLSESSARRETYTAISILSSCNRATRNGKFVELI